MAVDRKSRIASTNAARTDTDEVITVTTIFRTKRIAFAAKLMYIATLTMLSSISVSSSGIHSGIVSPFWFSVDSSFELFSRGVCSSGLLGVSGILYRFFGVLSIFICWDGDPVPLNSDKEFSAVPLPLEVVVS